jgi:ubiquinone/menaquinone biosynthesis C-methylase UbiE
MDGGWWFRRRLKRGKERLERLELTYQDPLLDLGSGDGVSSTLLAHQQPDGMLLAIDRNCDLLGKLRKKWKGGETAHLTTVCACFDWLPLRKESIGLVLVSFSLHYTINKQRVLLEALRVLKGGGDMGILEYQGGFHQPWIRYPIGKEEVVSLITETNQARIISSFDESRTYGIHVWKKL